MSCNFELKKKFVFEAFLVKKDWLLNAVRAHSRQRCQDGN